MSIELVMPSNHLILCHPFLLLTPVFPSLLTLISLASASFPMSQLFASGGQSIGVSASASVLPMSIQDWFPFGWTGWIFLLSKGLSRVCSNTIVIQSIIKNITKIFFTGNLRYIEVHRQWIVKEWLFTNPKYTSSFYELYFMYWNNWYKLMYKTCPYYSRVQDGHKNTPQKKDFPDWCPSKWHSVEWSLYLKKTEKQENLKRMTAESLEISESQTVENKNTF